MHDQKGDKWTWDDVKALLTEKFGFWDKLALTDEQTQRLETVSSSTHLASATCPSLWHH